MENWICLILTESLAPSEVIWGGKAVSTSQSPCLQEGHWWFYTNQELQNFHFISLFIYLYLSYRYFAYTCRTPEQQRRGRWSSDYCLTSLHREPTITLKRVTDISEDVCAMYFIAAVSKAFRKIEYTSLNKPRRFMECGWQTIKKQPKTLTKSFYIVVCLISTLLSFVQVYRYMTGICTYTYYSLCWVKFST